MLSDILHEAEREIQQYQQNYPDIYAAMKAEINQLRCKLNVLRLKLDCSTGNYEDNPFYQAALDGDITPHDRFMDGESFDQIFGGVDGKKNVSPSEATFEVYQAMLHDPASISHLFDKCRKDGIKYVDGYGGATAHLVFVEVEDAMAVSQHCTGDWENPWVLEPFDWCEENCKSIWSFGKPLTPKVGYFHWRFFFERLEDAKLFASVWNGCLVE